MTPHLTRQEMYTLVWEAPIAEIASRLGVPEGRLRELCALHRVPVPAASYWRDKATGKRVKQTIFARTNDPRLELIALDPTRSPDPVLTEQLERQREIDASRRNQPTRASRQDPCRHEIQWDAIKHPHAAVAEIAKELRRSRPDGYGVIDLRGIGFLGTSIGATSVERAIFILDTLARALEARGIACSLAGKEATAIRGEDDVKFKLIEKVISQPHVPSIEELKSEDRRLRGRRTELSWGWEKAYPEFDRIPSGELCLSITSWGNYGLRRNWKDGNRASLEAQLPTIPDTFEAWVNGTKQDRLDRARQSRLWRREEENRQLAKARKERETSREALMEEIVTLKSKGDQFRGWLEWARSTRDPDTLRMIEWARQKLHSIEAALDQEGFGELLRKRSLFPEKDPLAPLPEDPDKGNAFD